MHGHGTTSFSVSVQACRTLAAVQNELLGYAKMAYSGVSPPSSRACSTCGSQDCHVLLLSWLQELGC